MPPAGPRGVASTATVQFCEGQAGDEPPPYAENLGLRPQSSYIDSVRPLLLPHVASQSFMRSFFTVALLVM